MRLICVPVYRLGQEPAERIDGAAEQIVHVIGLALASSDDVRGFAATHSYALGFLQQTLGGKLVMLEDK